MINFFINYTFDNKKKLILRNKAEEIKKYSESGNTELRKKLESLMKEDSVKLFEVMVENKEELIQDITLISDKLLISKFWSR